MWRKTFWLAAGAMALVAMASEPPAVRYPSPIELLLSADGSRLFVLCQGTDEVVAYDLRSGRVFGRVRVGHVPKGFALSRDGRRLYVANSWSDSISDVDTAALDVTRTLPAGFEPNAVIADRDGRFLFVANRISNDVSVVDLASGLETKRLLAGRGASYLASSPDGSRIFCTHIYPKIGKFRAPLESEITVIDAARQIVADRYALHNAAGVFHMALSADGRLGMAAQMRPKNLVPLAHVEHGWVIGNSISLFGEDIGGEIVQIPIDELDRYYTPPFAIALAPDKSTAYVSTTGSDSVTVIDIASLLALVRSLGPAERRALANDLSAAANYVVARIPVGHGPKGLALSPDGKRLYVANRTGDTISIVDTAARRVTGELSLDAPAPTPERRGERIFFNASFAFQGHFGCANCHIEATFDGVSWDLEPDGFGKDYVDNRLLEDVADTAPFKWNGGNPNLETECGPRTEKFFYRSESYDGWQLSDLVSFIKAMPLRPNRYRNGELTPAQERGKAIFERTRRKDGTPIPEKNQCAVCHSGPHYTNQKLADVGTVKPTDRSPLIDTPQLSNIALTAPYLHDGSARSLEEIWTVFNPNDTHGVSNDLQKDELNDLIEYLKTL